MATTLTATLAASNADPKRHHAGVNCIAGSYTGAGLSASGSGMLLLCKIPPDCTVVGLTEYHSSGATAQTLNFGVRSGTSTSASVSAIAADLVLNANNSAAGKLPFTCTREDTSNEKFKYVVASLSAGTVTASQHVNFQVFYQVDD